MALTLDEKGLGESFGKLAEGKTTDAAALLANVLVTALMLPLIGPAAVGVGKAAEGPVRALANRIADSAIRRMVRAGEEIDVQRAGVAAIVEAVAEVLSALEQRQFAAIDDSRTETQEQFLQLITFMRHNVVAPLEELRNSVAATVRADRMHDRQPPTPAAILDLFRETTDELLIWPQTLRDGTWLDRPEMEQILDAVRRGQQRPVVLLGLPGSGKSALLARVGGTLRADGWQVVAIKADRLPAEVGTLRALREHLEIDMPIDGALEALGREGKTLLLVDQLDALSDLVDLRTERLSVLLALINRVTALENVRVVCSAREFDFHHDVRFQRLDPIEIRLGLPSDAQVDAVLAAAGIKSADLPAKLRALLRTPQWLKLFLHLSFGAHEQLPTTWRGLLEAVWEQTVLRPPAAGHANETAAFAVAKQMAESEELWVPRARFTPHGEGVARLLSAGILLQDRTGVRIGFAHQSLYEFARARAFLAAESLATHVLAHQDSLFVRPTLWTGLTFLRDADINRYHAELENLFAARPRLHVHLLLVEFLGQQAVPDDFEASVFLPALRDRRWQQAAYHSIAGSRGWFAILRKGYLQAAMVGETPGLTVELLCRAAEFDRTSVFDLIEAQWKDPLAQGHLVFAVLVHLTQWCDRASALAERVLSAHEQRHPSLEMLLWQVARTAPDNAVQLLANQLDREFERIRKNLPHSPPFPENGTMQEKFAWSANHEPRQTVQRILDSGNFSFVMQFATSSPKVFLARLLPWFAAILGPAAEPDKWSHRYLEDHLLHAAPGDGQPPHEFADALRCAVERMATDDPAQFLAVVGEWRSFDLLSVHRILSYGLEKLAATHPEEVVEYLAADPRRLSVGDYSDPAARTLALISAVAPNLDGAATRMLERAVVASAPSSESIDDVQSRRHAREHNRCHRFRLLRVLPIHFLSASAVALVDDESRVFGNADAPIVSMKLREIGSPMSANQMELASDDDIVGLFEELVDATGFNHPKRFLEGGVVQASREFGAFAKLHPGRAVAIVAHLTPGKHENPAGEAVTGIAESSLSTEALLDLTLACDKRGFCSETFRTDAARALEKRAAAEAGLPEAAIALFRSWLPDAVQSSASANSQQERPPRNPPFLWGWMGGEMLPGGSYPILSALSVALLSCKPNRANEWLDLLVEHLRRDDSRRVWLVLTHYLKWLGLCDADRASLFLDDLFGRYPDLLECSQGLIVLARASWWMDEAVAQKWTRSLRESTWTHAAYAYGELLGFYSVRIPNVAWADEELSELVRTSRESQPSHPTLPGAATSIVHMWSDPGPRRRCTEYLAALLSFGEPEIDQAIVPLLGRQQAFVDDCGERILECLAARPECFLVKGGEYATNWVATLVFARPDLAAQVVEGVAALLATGKGNPAALFGAATELIDLSLTLQRIPEFRVRGLTAFEQLLEAGLYGARQALDRVDDLAALKPSAPIG